MIDSFEKAFVDIIGIEGGYVNDPADPGGETKYGISKRSYPDEDIKNLTIDRAKQLYRRDYWNKCCCDQLPFVLAACVFDAAVNQGCSAAIKTLQKSLGLAQDGIVGSITIKSANETTREQIALYMADRALRYVETKNFDRFGRGWLKRLFLLAMTR